MGNIQIEKNGQKKEKKKHSFNFEGEYLKRDKKDIDIPEFVLGKLAFEGEYLEEKRNGKGREYYEGKLIFEGEYLKGQRWNGKGKEYWYYGKIEVAEKSVNTRKLKVFKVFEKEYIKGEKIKGKELNF